MNILVVGGAGYVGGAVTDYLIESSGDYKVRVYDNLLYEESYLKQIDFIYGDIRDRDKLLPQLKWADIVVWLAAIVGDGACAINPETSKEVNQDSVQWLSQNYTGRIISMSTCSVYGANNKTLDETSETRPLSIYASTKLEAEKYLYDKNALIFRLGTLFGVGDTYSRIRMDLVVNIMTMRAYKYGKLSVFGGDQFRPLLHVKDVAKTICENLTSEATGIYNLCCRNTRINDLAYQIRTHFPDIIIEQTPMLFEDSRNYRVSNQKAINELNFSPNFSIDCGIEEIKYLLETYRLKDIENPRYSNQIFLSKGK